MPPRLHPAQTPNSICLLFVVSSASAPQSSRQQQMYPVLCCSVSLSLKDPGRGTMRAPASRDGVKPWRKAAKNVPYKRAPRGFFCMGSRHWAPDGTRSPNRRGTFWPSHVVLVVGTKRRRKPWRAIPPGNWAVASPSPFRSTPSAPP